MHCHKILRTHRLTNRLCRAHNEDRLLEKHASGCARTAVRRCVVYLMFGDSAMKVQLAVGHIFKRLVMSGRELVFFSIFLLDAFVYLLQACMLSLIACMMSSIHKYDKI